MRFCAPRGSCSVGSCRAAVRPCCCCCRCVTLQLSAERTGCSRGGHRPSNDLSPVWASHLTQSTDAMLCNSNRVGRSDRPPEPGRRVIQPCQHFSASLLGTEDHETRRDSRQTDCQVLIQCTSPARGSPLTERWIFLKPHSGKRKRVYTKLYCKKIPVYTENAGNN